jgi:hypothetical protein
MIDERLILHRYKATSHAAVAGGCVLLFFWIRGYVRGIGFQRDLFIIMAAMAATKLAALTYYRLKD